jgi:hypothetical protein
MSYCDDLGPRKTPETEVEGASEPSDGPPEISGEGTSDAPEDDFEVYLEQILRPALDPASLSDDLELALLQLDAKKLIMWGVGLDAVIRRLVPTVLEHGPKMDEEHLDECIDIAVDEFTIKGHGLILRRSKEQKVVSLGEMTREVFSPEDKRHDEFRKSLRDDVMYRMRDVGLWSFREKNGLLSKNGEPYHAGWDLWAGPILLEFHRLVYMKWSLIYAETACKLIHAKKDR